MSALPLGVSTYSYVYTHKGLDAMMHMADLGVRGFELLTSPPHLWPPELTAEERREIPARLAERGLEIVSFCYPSMDTNFTSPSREIRQYTVDNYKRLIDVAGEWGVPIMLFLPGRVLSFFPAPYEWMMEWVVEAVRELAPHAKSAGVKLLMENIPFTFLPKMADVIKALDNAGEDSVGILCDVANAKFVGEDPSDALRLCKDRLGLVHVSDTPSSTFRHDPIGMGEVDFQAVAKTLGDLGYTGQTIFELVYNDPDPHLVDSMKKLEACGWQGLQA